VIGAALAAFEYVNKNTGLIARLRENACLLKEGLAVIGLLSDNPTVPIAPLYFNEPEKLEKLSQKLLEAGILAPLVNYPGSPDGGLIRLAVSAAHSKDQISRLLECLKKNI
jgi:7-keto-8-aminopelargonate synthetase-like enzyme